MLERREVDFLFRAQGEQRSFDNFRERIHRGLDIDGASFLKLPKEVEGDLVNDFAETLTATSKHLKIRLPEIGLIHGWNEPLRGYSENHEVREILAHAVVDDKYPNGIIRISPFYLKPEFTYRVGIDQKPILPLELLLPHEIFHIWQFFNKYEKLVEDMEVLKKNDLAAWNQTQTEINAYEFANYWIENY